MRNLATYFNLEKMKRTFAERLGQLMTEKGLTAYRVSKETEVSEGHLSNMLKGRRPPTDEVLSKLAPVLGVPFDELKAWANADKLGAEELAAIRQYIPEAMGMRGVEIPMGKMPYAGEVGCGRQLVLHPEEDLDLPQEAISKGDFSVKACGDSMNKARIDDGDILIVKRQDWAEDGQIVIANLEWDGATCKRYRVTNEGPYLVPESYSLGWEPIPVTREVTILGVVKYIHRPGIELG